MVGLLVALGKHLLLGGKAGTLVDGVVQLGIGICHLPAVHKELKALHIVRILRLLLGERRDLNGVIHHKGGLDQVLLYIRLKEQIENIALLVALLILDLVGVRRSAGLLQGVYLLKINAAVLLDRVYHGDAGKGLGQIHLNAVISNLGGAQHSLGHMAIHPLGQVHHTVIIGICLVQLHQGEFRVMASIHAFVTEHAPDLIHTLQAAYNQPL